MATEAPMQALVDLYVGSVDEIKVIDGKLDTFRGTQTEWMKKGKEAARATVLRDFVGLTPIGDTLLEAMALDNTVGAYLDAVTAHLEAATQFGQELCIDWIKSNRKDSDETDSLTARRTELVKNAEAQFSVLTQLGLAEGLPALPASKTPAKTSSGSGTGTKVTKSEVSYRFFVVRDGERVFRKRCLTDMSALAFYQPLHVDIETLKAAMTKAGWDGSIGGEDKEFEVSYTNKDGDQVTRKLGWVIDRPAKDEPKDDEPKDGDKK